MRADLLALTAETLAELTNRGLVKRAGRELERVVPVLTEDDDGTVHAAYPDGVGTDLPGGGLELGKCSCGAAGICRHVVGLVLAYQQQRPGVGPTASPPIGGEAGEVGGRSAGSGPSATATGGRGAGTGLSAPAIGRPGAGAGLPRVGTGGVSASREVWSPGEFSDEQLVARLGERMVAAARRVRNAGYVARVHRGRVSDPVPGVELPTATVRFLVPHELGFARTDAASGVRDDVLALAVWAFRAADEQGLGGDDVQVQVGGGAAAVGGAGLESAVALAGLVLREGAVHVGAGLAADVAVVRRELEGAGMRWPLLAVEDLVGQLDAYQNRSARYRPEALADHVAELFARHRAVTGGGSGLRSRVLGTDEASETPLRRARLDGLGARVSAVGDERVVDLFLAHADSSTVLVLRRAYETDEAGPQLAARRVAGVTIGALAGGAVVTESAARSASRAVRLGTRRLSRTEAMVSRGSWQDLPRALIADDLTALAAELNALPPRPIRARVQAELVRVIPVAEVRSVSYSPGAQRLDAVIADATGATAVVSATYASCAPGRLDSMAEVLRGEVRFVSGTVRRSGGGVLIEPIGFAVQGGVVIPDLAPAVRGTDPDHQPEPSTDRIGQALDDAAALLGEVAHRGLQHSPATMGGRLRGAATRLKGTGLRRVGTSMEELAALLGPDPGDAAVEAWIDAYLRVSVAGDMRPTAP
ncbi:hypothetical protein [Winogradskya humida]|uniref:hypothetical protein n=1 Tax=Winogradskya humida TaxID=113566 RepID=UPI00337C97F8